MVGTTPDWLRSGPAPLAEGRFLTAADETERGRRRPCSARPRPASCSARSDPLGQTVNVNGVPLDGGRRAERRRASASSATNEDDQALVPLSTMEQQIGGVAATSVDTIYVEATSPATLSAAYQEANALLLNLHGVSAAERRLHHQQPAVAAVHRHLGQQDADRAAGRHRRDLAAGRRHRRHEHHAGLGHRADPRDRPAQGARRHAPGDPAPVPGRGVAARPGRRGARRGASAWPARCCCRT